ncbi:ClpXP protease specificity-enhancing factor [Actimicrobium sp. CCC2.4]|uniref:ClpXP protease specificity-enhancing factor n=1 Tax=Actimicrobium sp. CCC2.4 TaxID=3048606 RepID=UPI002AC8D9E9|nr:ClpXP protease specificity-enhancing factor [Actimicrobium sp. CCC2.4]MEB0135525.1 ClpXP protease specificity-enhancing factor [Actimicrobium sp. CCC2.4]WPX32306.1 ClpXP protease specificity-enhancing factor [Actimicrobium sp. CCC2.4]
MSEPSTKPYLLRAIYEWCTDNGYTPYLAVLVDASTKVPMQFVKNGEIVLNISFDATSALKMDNDLVRFSARFGGVSRDISVPVDNIIAIYARENGQGMAFEVSRLPARDDDTVTEPGDSHNGPATDPVSTGPTLTSVPSASQENGSDGEDPQPPKKGGRPTLTRIK